MNFVFYLILVEDGVHHNCVSFMAQSIVDDKKHVRGLSFVLFCVCLWSIFGLCLHRWDHPF